MQHRSFDIRPPPANPQRRTYLGITGVLLVIVLALAGGIIWYNTKKSNQLVVAAADRMIEEVGEHVSDRLKLIYDPMYVIIGTASLMPELTSPSISEDPWALSLIRRVLSIYPQILSLYVGSDTRRIHRGLGQIDRSSDTLLALFFSDILPRPATRVASPWVEL